MTGLNVVEANIFVQDVKILDEEPEDIHRNVNGI